MPQKSVFGKNQSTRRIYVSHCMILRVLIKYFPQFFDYKRPGKRLYFFIRLAGFLELFLSDLCNFNVEVSPSKCCISSRKCWAENSVGTFSSVCWWLRQHSMWFKRSHHRQMGAIGSVCIFFVLFVTLYIIDLSLSTVWSSLCSCCVAFPLGGLTSSSA